MSMTGWANLALADLVAPTPTTDPNPDGANITIPAMVPTFDGPGVRQMATVGANLAGGVLIAAVIVIILSAGILIIGPRLSFHGAKALGVGGIIGGFFVGGIVALATPGVQTAYHWFS